ncbi:redoxin [Rufibacter radiotolerans]|uniref:Redoxin n=1 Tax=Rufibacter radiotolerans TaxID=1379910 RepID=A0A0H4VMZ3_9BACT|nr:thioredoxin family protein [Rufibacter radiotolerans]AKQ46688.1 redoxin [Rufibacter radiotolerans]
MKKTNFYLAVLGTLLVLASAFQTPENGYRIGDTAADFRLKNVDGQLVSLRSQKHTKGFIIAFTCNTCPYSKLYEDRLIQLHQKYAPQGYPVIAINPNDAALSPGDAFTEMQKRASEKNFPFVYLQDETQETAKRYGATRTPHLYVLTRQGQELKVAYIGAIDDNSGDPEKVEKRYTEAALDHLLAGKPVPQPTTKAIGCAIKWRNG